MAVVEVKEIDRESVLWLVQELDDFEKDKAIRSGLASAVNVFKVLGRGNLRRWMGLHGHSNGVTGNLLAAFKNRVKKSKPGALAGFYYAKNDMDWPRGNHAHFVDEGTSSRKTTGAKSMRAGISRGIMPASHFWDDAKVQGEGKAMQRLQAGIERAIQRINERRK